MNTSRWNGWLIALLTVALILRIGWGLVQPRVIDERLPDQREYLETARNLLDGRGLKFFDPRFGQEVVAFRTPGYPLFLAGCGGSVVIARIVQGVLDTSTVLAIYLLARRWRGRGTALLAAVGVAFNPFLIYFSGLILTETLFAAMLAWGMVLLVYRLNYLWGGLVLALSILVRPSALFLPIVLGYAAVFVQYRRGEIEQRRWYKLPVGATMILLIGLVLTPWAIRNRVMLGEWVLLTTNEGITRYDGFNPEATGASDQRFVQSAEFSLLKRMNEVQRDRYMRERSSEWVRETLSERPARLISLTANKLARTWSPVPLSQEFGQKWLYKAAAMAYSIPLDLLIVTGLWLGHLPRRAKLFLVLPALYFTAIHMLSVGSLRYRVPSEPQLAIVAAVGLVAVSNTIGQWMGSPKWKRVAGDDIG